MPAHGEPRSRREFATADDGSSRLGFPDSQHHVARARQPPGLRGRDLFDPPRARARHWAHVRLEERLRQETQNERHVVSAQQPPCWVTASVVVELAVAQAEAQVVGHPAVLPLPGPRPQSRGHHNLTRRQFRVTPKTIDFGPTRSEAMRGQQTLIPVTETYSSCWGWTPSVVVGVPAQFGLFIRDGCTRIGSPSIFGKFGGYGASPRS